MASVSSTPPTWTTRQTRRNSPVVGRVLAPSSTTSCSRPTASAPPLGGRLQGILPGIDGPGGSGRPRRQGGLSPGRSSRAPSALAVGADPGADKIFLPGRGGPSHPTAADREQRAEHVRCAPKAVDGRLTAAMRSREIEQDSMAGVPTTPSQARTAAIAELFAALDDVLRCYRAISEDERMSAGPRTADLITRRARPPACCCPRLHVPLVSPGRPSEFLGLNKLGWSCAAALSVPETRLTSPDLLLRR
jgi:hypothetical protein